MMLKRLLHTKKLVYPQSPSSQSPLFESLMLGYSQSIDPPDTPISTVSTQIQDPSTPADQPVDLGTNSKAHMAMDSVEIQNSLSSYTLPSVPEDRPIVPRLNNYGAR